MHVQWKDRPGILQSAGDLSVFCGNTVPEELTCACDANTGCIYVVLQRDGNSVKRHRPRGNESRIGSDRNKGIDRRVELLDPPQTRLRQFNWRYNLVAQRVRRSLQSEGVKSEYVNFRRTVTFLRVDLQHG